MDNELNAQDYNGHVPATPEPQPEQADEVCVCQCCLEEDPIYLLGYERGRSELMAAILERVGGQLAEALGNPNERAA